MRFAGILTLCLLCYTSIYSQSSFKLAPYNPDYMKFLEEYAEGEEKQAAPAPFLHDFSQYFLKKQVSEPKSFPIAYDLRTAGPGGSSYLTSVKHQLSCGACWAFATYGAIESAWKRMGLGDYDLSENNLKNCSGFDTNPCQWGHHFMSTAYLVRGSGPVSETDDPYQPANNFCQGLFTPVCFVPEARYLPEDHDAFKEVIMTVGPVYNSFRSVSASYQQINGYWTFCYQGGSSTSHAIAIVGWNDTITTGCGTGAWLVKDQYGPTYRDGGFYYIAYQDTLVLKYNAFWPHRELYDQDLKIYHYDTIGGWPFAGYEDPTAYGLVKYTAADEQFITKVGTYSVSFGTHLQVDIYDHFDGVTLSGLLTSTPELYCEYPGFHLVELPQPVRIQAADDFFVRVRYYSPGCDFPVAVEAIEAGYTNPHIQTGKCFVSPDGLTWEALGTGMTNELDLCIKVYAYDVTRTQVKVFLEGSFTGSVMETALQGVLPLIQPYSQSPWNYNGVETVQGIPDGDIVDWLLLELRETEGLPETATSAKIIARKAVFLKSNGLVVDLDGSSYPAFDISVKHNLHVVIHHRNHLSVMSAQPISKSGSVYHYDFTDSLNKAYGGGNGYKDSGNGVFVMVGGDGLVNGSIEPDDHSVIWQQQAGKTGYQNADYDMNKQVNNPDKNRIWLPNQGFESQVPD
jgi:C1A family cysteine protease